MFAVCAKYPVLKFQVSMAVETWVVILGGYDTITLPGDYPHFGDSIFLWNIVKFMGLTHDFCPRTF